VIPLTSISRRKNLLVWFFGGLALLLILSAASYLSIEPAAVKRSGASAHSLFQTAAFSSAGDPDWSNAEAESAAHFSAGALSEREWIELIEKCEELNRRYGELEQRRREISRAGKIDDPDPLTLGEAIVSGSNIRAMSATAREEMFARQQQSVTQMEAQLAQLEALGDQQLTEACAILGIEVSPSESKRLAELREDEARTVSYKRAGFPPNHADVERSDALLRVHRKAIAERMVSIRRASRTRLMIEKATLQKGMERLAIMKEEQRIKEPYHRKYLAVKAEQIQVAKELRAVLQIRREAERNGGPPVRVREWRQGSP
jgi:hypothetical protein